MIADDRVDDEIARECAVVMRLAEDPQRLCEASMHVLFRSGATLTRAIVRRERGATAEVEVADVTTLAQARQRIMTEIRRRS